MLSTKLMGLLEEYMDLTYGPHMNSILKKLYIISFIL